MLGACKVKDQFTDGDESILDNSNWQEAYWNRSKYEGFTNLLTRFKSDSRDLEEFPFGKDPNDISLREFMTHFTMKWNYTPIKKFPYISSKNVFPHVIPTYRYVVRKGSPIYEQYCKTILLMDKPGCMLENVGKNFASCEEELRDFVENYECCPILLKDEFKESQRKVGPNDKETPIAGDAFDELLPDNDADPEYGAKEDWMQCHDLGFEGIIEPPDDDDQNENLNDFEVTNDDNNWESDLTEVKRLNSDYNIKDTPDWTEYIQKVFDLNDLVTEDLTIVDPSTLNSVQKLAYNHVIKWVDKIMEDPNTPPLNLNISGRGGCGKTYCIMIEDLF